MRKQWHRLAWQPSGLYERHDTQSAKCTRYLEARYTKGCSGLPEAVAMTRGDGERADKTLLSPQRLRSKVHSSFAVHILQGDLRIIVRSQARYRERTI